MKCMDAIIRLTYWLLPNCSVLYTDLRRLTFTLGLSGASTVKSVADGPYSFLALVQLALISISSLHPCGLVNGLPPDTHNNSSLFIASNLVIYKEMI